MLCCSSGTRGLVCLGQAESTGQDQEGAGCSPRCATALAGCGVSLVAAAAAVTSTAPANPPLPTHPCQPTPALLTTHPQPPLMQVAGNPCLAYAQHIVLPWCEKFEVERKEDNGGNK